MAQSLKALLYRYLFALSPKKVQQMYFQGKTLVPKEELLKAYSHAVISLKKKGNLGDYLEFGVFKGDSLACMYKVLKQEGLDSVRLFGFDSFEGLPDITDAHDKSLPWQKGEFVSTIETTKKNLDKEGVDWNRTFLIKGFFSTNLTQELLKKHTITKASFIMIDCDLYSAAKEALEFCVPLIQDEAVVFFDDWVSEEEQKEVEKGENLAFKEILQANPDLKAEELGEYVHTEQEQVYTSKYFLVTRTKSEIKEKITT